MIHGTPRSNDEQAAHGHRCHRRGIAHGWDASAGGKRRGDSRGGADGSIVLPPDYSVDSGPTNLFTLAAGAAPGDYVFGCRFLDPASGALRAEDLTRFKVE